jgi:hypothetical protein
MTHTYAVLEVSQAAYAEIRALLDAAGYRHAFHADDLREVIDMHGIALAVGEGASPQADIDRLRALLGKCLAVFETDVDVPGTDLVDEVRAALT